MRPIKFRAYDRIDERIYYDVIPFGEFVVLKYSQAGYEMLDIEIEDYDLIYSEDFSDYEIMQYSRCIDTNGVDIYEGDRLLIESEEEPYKWKTYVKSDGLFSVEVYGYDYDWTPLQLLMEDNSITNVEVIGNNLEELKE